MLLGSGGGDVWAFGGILAGLCAVVVLSMQLNGAGRAVSEVLHYLGSKTRQSREVEGEAMLEGPADGAGPGTISWPAMLDLQAWSREVQALGASRWW